MTNDLEAQDSAQAPGGATGKFRDWQGTLNCGITGETCRLKVEGQYHLNLRDGWKRLEKNSTDFDPKLFTIDVVDTDGKGGDWIDLRGEFEENKEVVHVILQDEHGNRHKFPVKRI